MPDIPDPTGPIETRSQVPERKRLSNLVGQLERVAATIERRLDEGDRA